MTIKNTSDLEIERTTTSIESNLSLHISNFEHFLMLFGITPKLKSVIIQDKKIFFGYEEEILVSDSCYKNLEKLFPFLDVLNSIALGVNKGDSMDDLLDSIENNLHQNAAKRLKSTLINLAYKFLNYIMFWNINNNEIKPNFKNRRFESSKSERNNYKKIINNYIEQMQTLDTPLTNLTCGLLLSFSILGKVDPGINNNDKAILFIEKVINDDESSNDILEYAQEVLQTLKAVQESNNDYDEIIEHKKSWMELAWHIITAPFKFIRKLFYKKDLNTEFKHEIISISSNKQTLFIIDEEQRNRIKTFLPKEKVDDLCDHLQQLFEDMHLKIDNIHNNDRYNLETLNKNWNLILDNIYYFNKAGFKATVAKSSIYANVLEEFILNKEEIINNKSDNMIFSDINANQINRTIASSPEIDKVSKIRAILGQ